MAVKCGDRWRGGRRLLAAVGLGVALAAGWGSTAGAAANLLPNGTFEGTGAGSLAGWSASSASLSLANDGDGGGFAAHVAYAGGGASYNIHASPKPVTDTTAGTTYTATGRLRSDTPGASVCLKLTEFSSAGAVVGHRRKCVRATSGWASFPTVTYTTTQTGGSIGYFVLQSSPTAGQSFEVDNLTLTASSGGPAEPIIVIMEENKTYGDIVGNPNAPYIQSLIQNGTLYTNYQAGPGSLPDYLANTSGLTGSTSNSDNIFHQLQSIGVSWGEYEESMPRACDTGGNTGAYDKAHNPAVYYDDITSVPSVCANVVPYTAFDPAHLRAFSYVVPNLNDDMHDGPNHTAQIEAGDAWLSAHVPAMLNAGAEVIVTWDEGNSSDEHVATIAIGGTAAAGVTDSHAYTHPGLLAGLEDAWGLPLLNAAKTANPVPIS